VHGIRRRDALELPTPDSAQSTAKLFSATTLSTRGTSIGSVRRVPRPEAAPRNAPAQAAGQLESAQVKSCPPTDADQTESDDIVMAGEPDDVSLNLRSIFEGATA